MRVTRDVNGSKRDSVPRRLFHMNVWWVPVLCAILSARFAYVNWYKRRRSALVEASRTAAIAALQSAGTAGDDLLVNALAARDADSVTQWLASYSGPRTMAIEAARRYADAERATIAYFQTHFVWSTIFGGSLTFVLIQVIGAAVVEVRTEHATAQAYDAQLRVIGLVHMVNHLDSAFGHTVVLVVYRPGPTVEDKVRALGAVTKKAEFYPVACCVSLDSASAFFQHSALPYRQRLLGGGANHATMFALRAVGAGQAPDSGGFVSVIDPTGVMIAHWNALPDSSELRATLH